MTFFEIPRCAISKCPYWRDNNKCGLHLWQIDWYLRHKVELDPQSMHNPKECQARFQLQMAKLNQLLGK